MVLPAVSNGANLVKAIQRSTSHGQFEGFLPFYSKESRARELGFRTETFRSPPRKLRLTKILPEHRSGKLSPSSTRLRFMHKTFVLACRKVFRSIRTCEGSRHLRFSGDTADMGIIRHGAYAEVKTVLQPRVHLVPYHVEGGQPSYLIIAGLVFTPLSEPLIEEECEDSIGLKLLAKARYSLAKFKGEQIVILSQVLANDVNIGYEDMGNQQVLKLNETRIKNIRHLAHLVDSCKGKYLVFEFEDNFLAVLDREAASSASACILKDYGIPSERSVDLSEPYIDNEDNLVANDEIGDSPVSNLEIGFDGLLWA